MDLLPDFLISARGRAAFDPDRGLVVALSGGADSTALLDLAIRATASPDRIVAAHLDHALREESAQEALLVAKRADRAGVRCHCRRVDVARIAKKRGAGHEAAGREARYAFLESVACEEGLELVATGHHLNDQAETVVHRVLRGSGARGVRGILARRPIREGSQVRVVRPLLAVPRARILEYVRERRLPYLDDPTNEDGSNLRSLIRTKLLPALASVPRLAERLAALAEGMQSVPGLPRPSPTAAKPARPASPPDPGHVVELRCPGEVRLPGGLVVTAEEADSAEFDADRNREVIDRDCAPPPYLLRYARPGDRFRPLGLGAETTVYRFLLGKGVPREERSRTAVVLAGEILVWVVGYRIDDRAKVGPRTARRVRLGARG